MTPERWVKIEQLGDGGRREFIFSDRAGMPSPEEEATHVEVIDYDATGRFVSSTIAERHPLSDGKETDYRVLLGQEKHLR
jgi:hypothetical protein